MKKFLSLFSSMSFILCGSTIIYAWLPVNFTDPRCINLGTFGKQNSIIMLGQKGEKVGTCSKCTVDAVLYNSLERYIGELEKRFDTLSALNSAEASFSDRIKNFFDSKSFIKSKIYLENNVKINNIKLILEDIVKDIENKKFIKYNFLLVATNYDPNSPDAAAQFVKRDSIIYNENYDESYFNKLKIEKILPLLNKIEKYIQKNITTY